MILALDLYLTHGLLDDRDAAVDGDEALEDIARFVGHARPATTAGVKRLGRRPQAVARRAAAVLDGQGDQDATDSEGVRNDPPDLGSNRASNRSTRASERMDTDEP